MAWRLLGMPLTYVSMNDILNKCMITDVSLCRANCSDDDFKLCKCKLDGLSSLTHFFLLFTFHYFALYTLQDVVYICQAIDTKQRKVNVYRNGNLNFLIFPHQLTLILWAAIAKANLIQHCKQDIYQHCYQFFEYSIHYLYTNILKWQVVIRPS